MADATPFAAWRWLVEKLSGCSLVSLVPVPEWPGVLTVPHRRHQSWALGAGGPGSTGCCWSGQEVLLAPPSYCMQGEGPSQWFPGDRAAAAAVLANVKQTVGCADQRHCGLREGRFSSSASHFVSEQLSSDCFNILFLAYSSGSLQMPLH